MRVVIVDTYYLKFLVEEYRRNGLSRLRYEEQRQRLFDACFGVADFYSRHLRALGVEAEELVANCAPLQLAWLREHGGVAALPLSLLPRRLADAELLARVLLRSGALLPILVAQLRRARPDVVYVQDLGFLPPRALAAIKPLTKLLVGQIASPLPPPAYLAPYDLILTSFPHFVTRLRAAGKNAEYFRLGFDPSVLERVGAEERRYACTFVGGISSDHRRGALLLEQVARAAPVDFFGYGADSLPPGSAIRARHHGPVWGLDMYRVLGRSRITLNRHVDVAEHNANNMRLYEATGMGAMLLTDAKVNLGELFAVGKEVVAYESADEAVELIRHYSEHDDEREAIARAGQRRTLSEHTYERRMAELTDHLRRHLRQAPGR